MRRIISAAALAGLIAAAGLLVRPQKTARAQSGCSAATLTGPYGYSLGGTYYDAQGYSYVFASAGRMIFDGSGNITGADTINNDGSPARRQYAGSYVVNSDCTGTVTLTTTGATASTHGDIVLVSGGKEVNFVQTDANIIFSGTLKAQ